jgi:hypothetical protein
MAGDLKLKSPWVKDDVLAFDLVIVDRREASW